MSLRDLPLEAVAEMFGYLDDLRQSGVTNMYGARPYLVSDFDMDSGELAGEVLAAWMKTFSREEAPETRAKTAYSEPNP